jgi:hypothetical protein
VRHYEEEGSVKVVLCAWHVAVDSACVVSLEGILEDVWEMVERICGHLCI